MGWTTPRTWAAAVLTSAQMNEQVRDNTNFLKANIALDAAVELTISTGAVTKTKSYHFIDTESDASTDNLDTINGGSDGDVLFLEAEHTDRTVILKDGDGNLQLEGDIHLCCTGHVISLIYNGTLSKWLPTSMHWQTTEFPMNSFEYPAPGTDWTPALTGATLAQNKAAKVLWMPLHGFSIGDQFISYKLVGDMVDSTAATLDCKLVRINKADPITTTDVDGGGITQIDADGNFDSEATLTAAEVIATDKQYSLQITATTGIGDSIIVMGAEVAVISGA